MPYALIQSGTINSGSSFVTSQPLTLGAKVGIGNAVCISFQSLATFSSIADDKGNFYNVLQHDVTDGLGYYIGIAYLEGINNQPQTITVTWTGSQQFAGLTVDEFSGVALSSALEGSVGQFLPDTVSPIVSSNITTTVPGDLVWAFGSSSAFTLTPGPGFTAGQGSGLNNTTEYLTQGSAGPIACTFTPSMTGSPNGAWILGMALKPYIPPLAQIHDGVGDYWVKKWLKRRRQARKKTEERARPEPAEQLQEEPEKPAIPRPAPSVRTPPAAVTGEPVGRTFAQLRALLEADRRAEEANRKAQEADREDEERMIVDFVMKYLVKAERDENGRITGLVER